MLGFPAVVYFFMVYSFFGWVIENVYNFIVSRQFFKPNLLFGPFKPMYGVAPVLLILLVTKDTPLIITLLLCLVIPTFVEYISGVLLLTLYGRRWWDYSRLPFQFQGHICLYFSLCWVVLSFVCLKVVHPLIISSYEPIEPFWVWIVPLVCAYFIIEIVLTFRRRRVLVPNS